MDVHDQGDAALSSVLGLREVKIQTLSDMALGTVLDVLDNLCIFRRDEFGRSKFTEIYVVHFVILKTCVPLNMEGVYFSE